MATIPPYRRTFTLADNETATLCVTILSDATEGPTDITVPAGPLPTIGNSGCQELGTGATLRAKKTIVTSVLNCPAAEVETIHVQYTINGTAIVDHMNPTSVDPQPMITISIQFLQP